MLRTYGSIPCWRIVFSTFRRCMSFYTTWVKSGPNADVRVESDLAPIADVGRAPRHVAALTAETQRRAGPCKPQNLLLLRGQSGRHSLSFLPARCQKEHP